MNRRDLLKFFAVGTVIAPVSGNAPLAKLIEVPKVQIVEAAKIPEPIYLNKVTSFSLALHMLDGGVRHVNVGALDLLRANGQVTINSCMDIWFANTTSPVTNTGFLAGRTLLS